MKLSSSTDGHSALLDTVVQATPTMTDQQQWTLNTKPLNMPLLDNSHSISLFPKTLYH
jgi:hypothetical protein